MWEKLLNDDARNVYSHRLKVPGGWIVRTVVHDDSDGRSGRAVEQTFVSDPNHEWELEK
jgi:hypothetical protein